MILEKLIICLINWYKEKSLLVSLKGKNGFFGTQISFQNSYSSSDTGIKETKSLCGPRLNCGYFPNDVRFMWPEPLERSCT